MTIFRNLNSLFFETNILRGIYQKLKRFLLIVVFLCIVMLMYKTSAFLLFFFIFSVSIQAQLKTAQISGKIVDENESPIPHATIEILGKTVGNIASDSGIFSIQVSAGKAIALVFSAEGYYIQQRNFFLNINEKEQVLIRLQRKKNTLEEVIITSTADRKEAGLIRINPKNALNLPSPSGGIESLIKIFVGSNNELTSQFSVRGGNYDENLIYLNDFELFRPYLVRSGQQEGLSLINSELTGKVNFYNGGFSSRFGDKMSSVLDIQYKKPKQFGGSAYLGLLEQGFHIEGVTSKNKLTYLIGARNRSNQNILSAQETRGAYIPKSADIQALLTYSINPKWQIEALVTYSKTKFTLIPESSQLTSSVFSPFFSANLGLDIYFEGKESDQYSTSMQGFSAIYQPNSAIKLKWMLSHFANEESERYDITGAYLFGERNFDRSKPDFGSITNALGSGLFQQFARNQLSINNITAAHKGQFSYKKNLLNWGLNADQSVINDKLKEWERQDSAGYTLPFTTNQLTLSKALQNSNNLTVNRLSGYIQQNMPIGDSSGLTLSAGIRFNYNNLNQEFLLSPRIQLSYQPKSSKDIIWKMALGSYNQPPFYRELRRYDGSINTNLKAQRSWQWVSGFDYQFKAWNKPFRLSSEAYLKLMHQVVPYDIDNVRIRYSGENSAKAYAAGIEMRLIGEWVKDAESWISLGFMRTRENLNNDYYYNYYNSDGKLITAKTDNQVVSDSTKQEMGWLRRPTDRLLTFGMFFQDYLSTNKNFKVHLNFLVGSNMPYNIPNSVKYRNALEIDPYIRADIGFSALLIDSEKNNRRSHDPFRNINSAWLSFEIFNMLDRRNTISYMLIKDFSNTIYTLPNRLTPRLLNMKLLIRF